jgi:hypothetical protein
VEEETDQVVWFRVGRVIPHVHGGGIGKGCLQPIAARQGRVWTDTQISVIRDAGRPR